MLFHAPKTICSDVITAHTEMRYCCCILSPQTTYTLSQFFHLSLENDVTATLKRFLKPFLLSFILKWILIQFCPKKSRSKHIKWHPQSVNTGFHNYHLETSIQTCNQDNHRETFLMQHGTILTIQKKCLEQAEVSLGPLWRLL